MWSLLSPVPASVICVYIWEEFLFPPSPQTRFIRPDPENQSNMKGSKSSGLIGYPRGLMLAVLPRALNSPVEEYQKCMHREVFVSLTLHQGRYTMFGIEDQSGMGHLSHLD